MNYIKLKTILGAVTLAATLFALGTVPAFAMGLGVTVSSSVQISGGVRPVPRPTTTLATVLGITTRANTEIANRIDALNNLETRISGMERLSASEQSSLSTQIQAQIAAMTNLQAQISADESANNTSSLRTDVQSITQAYRIYALILPQGEIAAASDRIMAIASAMTTLSGNLQTRIAALQSASMNMSSSIAVMTDFNVQIANANSQAQSAITETASLQPDNGDATIMQSNIDALKNARAEIQGGQRDLVAARQDAMTIIKAIKAMEKMSMSASTTVQ